MQPFKKYILQLYYLFVMCYTVLLSYYSLLTHAIIYLRILIFPLANNLRFCINEHKLVSHAVFFNSAGFFSSMALVIHLCSVQKYQHQRRREDAATVSSRFFKSDNFLL